MSKRPAPTFRQGDVLIADVDFKDRKEDRKEKEESKIRPVLVISANWYNMSRSDIIVLSITSKIPSQVERDIYELSKEDLRFGNFSMPSFVKLGVAYTISSSRVSRQMGKLPLDTVKRILYQFTMDILAMDY